MFKLCITNDLGFEFWKGIPGWEGLYQASTYGRVRSLDRICTKKYSYKIVTYLAKGKIIKPSVTSSGYLFIALHKGYLVRQYGVHRLIAMTFIPTMDLSKVEVNHNDEKKDNNRVENLSYMTHKDNCQYGTRNIRVADKNSLPLSQYNLDGSFVRDWKSTREAERETGYLHTSISKACNGLLKTYKGYIWKYKEDA